MLSNFVFPHFQWDLDEPGRRGTGAVIVELTDKKGEELIFRKKVQPGKTLIAVTEELKGELSHSLLHAHDIFDPKEGEDSFNWKLRHGQIVDPGEVFKKVIISQNIVRQPVSSLTITEPLRLETSEGSESSQRTPKLVWCPRKCFSWTRSKFTDLFLHAKKKKYAKTVSELKASD